MKDIRVNLKYDRGGRGDDAAAQTGSRFCSSVIDKTSTC